MKVPSNVPSIGEEEVEAVVNVLRSGMLTSAYMDGGTHVRKFELSSAFVKSEFSVVVNYGT